MSQTPPPTVDELPADMPSIASPSNFAIRADAAFAALPAFRSQLVALATNVYNNAVDAFNNAVAAAASAASAAAQVVLAEDQVVLAEAQADAAAASAATAVNAPGTSATSSTSLTLATGSQTLTVQAGKLLQNGMAVTIARTSDPVNTRMIGIVSAYNSGTGALDVNISVKKGVGTFTDWTIILAGEPGTAGTPGVDGTTAAPVYKAAAFNIVVGSAYYADTSAGAFAALMPPTPVQGDSFTISPGTGRWSTHNLTLTRNDADFADRFGNTVAGDFICDVDGIEITLFFDSPNWKLI
jgi:hypothetical protein